MQVERDRAALDGVGAMVVGRQGKYLIYFYILPILVLCGLFLYFSIGFTIFTSFHAWNGVSSSMRFIGLKNYKTVINDPVIYVAFLHVLLFFIVTQIVQQGLGILFSVLLRSRLYIAPVIKTIIFMPFAMAPVVIASVFRIIMDPNVGALDNFLRAIHLSPLALDWLGNPRYALVAVMIVNIYEFTGFSMVLYYSSLLTIPGEIFEAARIDGSGFWNTLFRITIPSLRGSMSMQTVLGIIGSLKTFDIVYMMTNGGPGHSSEFPTTYLFKKAIGEFNGGVASTIGVFILVIALVFSILLIQLYSRSRK